MCCGDTVRDEMDDVSDDVSDDTRKARVTEEKVLRIAT